MHFAKRTNRSRDFRPWVLTTACGRWKINSNACDLPLLDAVMRIACPSCEAELNVHDDLEGKIVKCPKCSGRIPVKATAKSPTAVIAEDDLPRARRSSRRDDDDVLPRPSRRRRPLYDEDDDGFEVPRRSERRRSKNFQGPPWPLVLLVVVLIWAILLAVSLLIPGPIGTNLFCLVAGLMIVIGNIMIIVAAFKEDVLHGVLTLLIPFFGLYFVFTRYYDVWKGFHLAFYGGLFIATAGIVSATKPLDPLLAQQGGWAPPQVKNNGFVQPGNNPPINNPQFQPGNFAPPQPGNFPPPQPGKNFGPAGDDSLNGILAEMDRGNDISAGFAAKRLVRIPVNPEQQQLVVTKLIRMTKSNDAFARRSAVEALGVWGTANEVPLVLEFLNNGDIFAQMAAMEALGKLRDERALEPLVRCLHEFRTRHDAERALKQFGPAAEPHLIPLLTSPDAFLPHTVAGILEVVGTNQSIPHLQAAARRGGLVSARAPAAIRAIQARENK